jgi:hypothetical protein
MKEDKFLATILAGVGVLILLSLVIFFVRKSQEKYLPEDLPKNVVHNYILALDKGDYQRAYGYLADEDNKPSYEEFALYFFDSHFHLKEYSIAVEDVQTIGEKALVHIIVTDASSTDILRLYNHKSTATLTLQDGAWKIEEMPYPFWAWDWYDEED